MIETKDLIKKLIEEGVHFGHRTSRWHPKMAPFIWGYKNGVHLINVAKTAVHLEKAAKFLESVASERKTILWVGTKKVAQSLVQATGKSLGYPFVIHRWIGGTLTNYSQVKKSVTKLLHYEDILSKSAEFSYTKKEFVTFQKIADRLNKNVGSIKSFAWPVGAVVIIDVKKEQTALKEAVAEGIPVVGFVDTNTDPSLVDYVIPCNDDAAQAVKVVLDYLAQAVKRGQEKAAQKKESADQANVAEQHGEELISADLIVKSGEETEEGKRAVSKKKELARLKEEEKSKELQRSRQDRSRGARVSKGRKD